MLSAARGSPTAWAMPAGPCRENPELTAKPQLLPRPVPSKTSRNSCWELAKSTGPAGTVCSVTPVQGHPPGACTAQPSAGTLQDLPPLCHPHPSSRAKIQGKNPQHSLNIAMFTLLLLFGVLVCGFTFFPISFPIPVCTHSSSVLSHCSSRNFSPQSAERMKL